MILVPLKDVANQVLKTTLNNQVCTITVRQLGTWLYFSLSLPSGPVVTNVMGLNRVLMVREAYLGLVGDFAFIDLQGTTDPVYTGLGSPTNNATRYVLAYLAPEDL